MWRPLRLTKGCTSTIPTRVRRFASAQHAAAAAATHGSGARNATPPGPVSAPLDEIAQHLQTGSTLTKARVEYLQKKEEVCEGITTGRPYRELNGVFS